MKLKQKISHETNKPIPRCWITECRYTVAACGPRDELVYQVTAPQDRKPFAYTPRKDEVKNIILTHKAANA